MTLAEQMRELAAKSRNLINANRIHLKAAAPNPIKSGTDDGCDHSRRVATELNADVCADCGKVFL
jgi:hypothetical protein